MQFYVLLGTYNGEKFVNEQINSILEQTKKDFKLLIRDDGSSDSTPVILREVAKKDSRIEILDDDRGNLGPANNFELLLMAAHKRGADFFAFSDQDDRWIPNKLELSEEVVCSHPKNVPLLVHSDLCVVDEALKVISNSFMKYQGISHTDIDPLHVLIVQNFVTGCTVVVNRALVDVSTPFPENIVMHDWWLALCAAGLGVIKFIDVPTVLYRQHSANAIGAKSHIRNAASLLTLSRKSEAKRVGLKNFRASLEQARVFHAFISKSAASSNISMTVVTEYIDSLSPENGRLKSLIKLMRSGVRRQKLLSNLGLVRIAISSKRFKCLLASSGDPR